MQPVNVGICAQPVGPTPVNISQSAVADNVSDCTRHRAGEPTQTPLLQTATMEGVTCVRAGVYERGEKGVGGVGGWGWMGGA